MTTIRSPDEITGPEKILLKLVKSLLNTIIIDSQLTGIIKDTTRITRKGYTTLYNFRFW